MVYLARILSCRSAERCSPDSFARTLTLCACVTFLKVAGRSYCVDNTESNNDAENCNWRCDRWRAGLRLVQVGWLLDRGVSADQQSVSEHGLGCCDWSAYCQRCSVKPPNGVSGWFCFEVKLGHFQSTLLNSTVCLLKAVAICSRGRYCLHTVPSVRKKSGGNGLDPFLCNQASEMLERPVVGRLSIFRKTAPGQLPVCKVIMQTFATDALATARRVRAVAPFQVLFFPAFHTPLAKSNLPAPGFSTCEMRAVLPARAESRQTQTKR